MTSLLRTTTSRIAAAGAAIALATPVVLASPAFAGIQNPTPVTGVSSCNTTTGLHEITWTVGNNTGETVDIDSSTLSGAATGSPVFDPNPIPIGEVATSEGTLPGTVTGAVVLTVETSWVDGEFPMDAVSSFTLNLTACNQVTTTTTSTTMQPTTTTTAPPAVVPVVVTPAFTG
jgi:hypothetical protein